MTQISAKRISFFLGSLPGTSRPVVRMMIDRQEWMMLSTKAAPLAAGLVSLISNRYSVEAIAGIAFDYEESYRQNQLVVHPDSLLRSIYVRVSDFESIEGLKELFNK